MALDRGETAFLLKNRAPDGIPFVSSFSENAPNLVGTGLGVSDEEMGVFLAGGVSVSGGEWRVTKDRPYFSFWK